MKRKMDQWSNGRLPAIEVHSLVETGRASELRLDSMLVCVYMSELLLLLIEGVSRSNGEILQAARCRCTGKRGRIAMGKQGANRSE